MSQVEDEVLDADGGERYGHREVSMYELDAEDHRLQAESWVCYKAQGNAE